jgi:predicted pyridoxine 5'-phosphate oxidase superfamily flavin-nucleotide-binding protein
MLRQSARLTRRQRAPEAAMSRIFGDRHRELQRRFDTERLADRIEERLVRDHLSDENRAFIESLDMFFLATADASGRPNCSYKGGDPGFVRVLDPRTLAFPIYDGNGMYLSAGNTLDNPHVGLLFIDFINRKRLRVNGAAQLAGTETLAPPYAEAQFIVRVAVREVFPNCPRYIHRLGAAERSEFVPRAGVTTPVPNWKRMDWAVDVLPAGDPARRE